MDLRQCLDALFSIKSLPTDLAEGCNQKDFDFFEHLSKSLQGFLDQANIARPSTSTHAFDETCVDSRLKFWRIISFVLDELAQKLNDASRLVDDQYKVLPIKEIQTIKDGIELLILSGVLPFLDEGVGVPIDRRSKYIRYWKLLLEDLELRRSILHDSERILLKCIDSNEALGKELSNKFLVDIICGNEQMLELCDTRMTGQYESFLETISPIDLAQELTLLLKPRSRSIAIPTWFQKTIGTKLSKIVQSDDGVLALLLAYNEMGDSSLWTNEHVLFQLASQLARVPRGLNELKYYEKISLQFIDIIVNKRSAFPVSRLFALFIDLIEGKGEKAKQAVNVCIFDKLFGFWESLTMTTLPRSWSAAADVSICLLLNWSPEKVAPNSIKHSPRLLQIVPIFLQLLGGDFLATDNLTSYANNIKEQLLKIVSFALHNLINKENFFVTFILRSGTEEFVLKATDHTALAGSDSIKEDKFHIDKVDYGQNDPIILHRVTAILTYIKKLPKEEKIPILIGCIANCMKRWTEARKIETNLSTFSTPRFVELDVDQGLNIVWIHFVIGLLFEELADVEDLDCTNEKIVMGISTLIHNILTSTSDLLAARREFDVSANLIEHDEEQLMGQNVKLAIGLAGGLLLASMFNQEVGSLLIGICAAAELFQETVMKLEAVHPELISAANEAQKLCRTLKGEEIDTLVDSKIFAWKDAKVDGNQRTIDRWDRLRADLEDVCEAVRGQALLRVSNMVRVNYKDIEPILSGWLYERITETLYDDDSYVYLNAINALAEIAIADTKFLRRLVDMQAEWRAKPDEENELNVETSKEDITKNSAMRGRISEATGKVFRFLGALGPEWLKKLFPLFVQDLSSKEEIVRAGALSALADLIASCKGIGIDSEIDVILGSASSMMVTENSSLVRRAYVHLFREIIRAPGTDMILNLGGEKLRDLRRELTRLWKWDADYIVRLHADLALQEMKANMENAEKMNDCAIINIEELLK